MTGAARRQSNWTADEDQRLLKLVEAGKSWVFISANLKRPASSARGRLAYLLHHAIKAEFENEPAEPTGEGEGEMNERHLVDPMPELPDDTPIDRVRLPTRIHNVLAAAGLKTVREVRETDDETLLSFQDLGPASVTHLRKTLGLPSTDGVRPR
jgi:Bacterial RNA polymerase, alpha chain C terminal domain